MLLPQVALNDIEVSIANIQKLTKDLEVRVHTYIHTYIHRYIHTYILTNANANANLAATKWSCSARLPVN